MFETKSVWQSVSLNEIPWLVHGTASSDFGSTRYPKEGEPDRTAANRERFLRALGLDSKRLVGSKNVHGNVVAVVDAASGARAPECDGLLTSEPGIVLATKSADCLPLFFADPVTRTVAIAHAGWKGVMAGIAVEVMRAFQERRSTSTNLLVAVGPSIGVCHYKVSSNRREEMLARTPCIMPEDFSEGRVDLRAIVVRQLVSSGVPASNIDGAAPCTACQTDQFFSYTLTRDFTFGMLSVISIARTRE